MKTTSSLKHQIIFGVCLLLSLHCGGGGSSSANSGNTPATAQSSIKGVFSGSNSQHGTLAITINTTQVGNTPTTVSASGSLKIGSTSIPLAGTYTTNGASSLDLAGGGYSFTGQYSISHGCVKGTFAGPSGSAGAFVTLRPDLSGTITPFMGTFSGGATGAILFVVGTDNSMWGCATDSSNTTLTVRGTISGGVLTMTGEDSSGASDTTFVSASGLHSASTSSGTGKIFAPGTTYSLSSTSF